MWSIEFSFLKSIKQTYQTNLSSKSIKSIKFIKLIKFKQQISKCPDKPFTEINKKWYN